MTWDLSTSLAVWPYIHIYISSTSWHLICLWRYDLNYVGNILHPGNSRYRMILNMRDSTMTLLPTLDKTYLMEPNCFMARKGLNMPFLLFLLCSKYLQYYRGNTMYKYKVLLWGYKDSTHLLCKSTKWVLWLFTTLLKLTFL